MDVEGRGFPRSSDTAVEIVVMCPPNRVVTRDLLLHECGEESHAQYQADASGRFRTSMEVRSVQATSDGFASLDCRPPGACWVYAYSELLAPGAPTVQASAPIEFAQPK